MRYADKDPKAWADARVRPEEVNRYLRPGSRDLVDDAAIARALGGAKAPDNAQLQGILDRSLSIQDLSLAETATLMMVSDPDQVARMEQAALAVKEKVFDKRIVTFAPMVLGNECVNSCRYCGFRADNDGVSRQVLNEAEIRAQVEVLAGQIGHKRVLASYGEHPSTGVDYVCDSLAAIYAVEVPVGGHWSSIRQVNVNAAPFSVDDYRRLHAAGPGTIHVYQDTYERGAYAAMHPLGPKSDFRWRLYALHRAIEAGNQDVGLGVLYGLSDWRFEVLALLLHAEDLEHRFGFGPKTISFPRLTPALNTPLSLMPPQPVSDEDFLRAVTVVRLALPYVGLVVTAAEGGDVRRRSFRLGITQTDCCASIGVGAFHEGGQVEASDRPRFQAGDSRPLQAVVMELLDAGSLTSFCTAGYRCGRTGQCSTDRLRDCSEGKYCKMNAALTFREWLDDFADDDVRAKGEPLLAREVGEICAQEPEAAAVFMQRYQRTVQGERDLHF